MVLFLGFFPKRSHTNWMLLSMLMILFTLSQYLHGFVFGLFPLNVSYQLDVVIHAYIFISLPIPNRCGILWDFGHIPNSLERTV